MKSQKDRIIDTFTLASDQISDYLPKLRFSLLEDSVDPVVLRIKISIHVFRTSSHTIIQTSGDLVLII